MAIITWQLFTYNFLLTSKLLALSPVPYSVFYVCLSCTFINCNYYEHLQYGTTDVSVNIILDAMRKNITQSV